MTAIALLVPAIAPAVRNGMGRLSPATTFKAGLTSTMAGIGGVSCTGRRDDGTAMAIPTTGLALVDHPVYNSGMNPKSRHKTAAPSAVRERILHTAHDLFYRDGIRATGIDKVIAEASVTKVTFYRHFPSKNELVQAFLDYRHQRWITWFNDALARRRQAGAAAVVDTLKEWFQQPDFRGCAFINTVVELGGSMPLVETISQQHKQDMTNSIRDLLPLNEHRDANASAIAMAVDGAIIRAQYSHDAEAALQPLARLVSGLVKCA